MPQLSSHAHASSWFIAGLTNLCLATTRFVVSTSAVLIAALAWGCSDGAGTHSKVRQTEIETAPALVDSDVDQQPDRFVSRLLAAVNQEPGTGSFSDLLDFDAFINATVAGLAMSQEDYRAFAAKIRDTLDTSVVAQIQSIVTEGGSYSFVRYIEDERGKQAIMRMLTADGSLNYHYFRLAERTSGDSLATDFYVFTAGEWMSQMLRFVALQRDAHDNRSVWDRLRGKEFSFVKHAKDFDEMAVALQDNDPVRASEIYERLPRDMQEMKPVLLLKISAATLMSDENPEAYLAAVREYRKLYPHDRAVDIMSVDYFRARKQYEKCFDALSRIEQEVKDPFLRVVRSKILAECGDLGSASGEIRLAINEAPDLEAAYEAGVTVSLKRNDHEATLAYLKQLSERFGTRIIDLSMMEGYDSFAQSSQYKIYDKKYR